VLYSCLYWKVCDRACRTIEISPFSVFTNFTILYNVNAFFIYFNFIIIIFLLVCSMYFVYDIIINK